METQELAEETRAITGEGLTGIEALAQRIGVAALRCVLGAVFLVFGMDGFIEIVPLSPIGEQVGTVVIALAGSSSLFFLVKGTEIACGVLLVSNRLVPRGFTLAFLCAIVGVDLFLWYGFWVLTPLG